MILKKKSIKTNQNQSIQISQGIKNLISIMDEILYDSKKEQELYNDLTENTYEKYWQLQDDELLKIMQNDQNKYLKQFEGSNKFLQQIIQDCLQIQYIIEEQKNNDSHWLKMQKFKSAVNFKTQYTINIAQISHNEEYLALGGENQEIIVKYLKQNKDDSKVELSSCVKACKFSLNDQYLYCGEISGNLSVYDLEQGLKQEQGLEQKQGLKQIYQKKIHTQAINNLIVNQLYIISCSDDLSIIITDIKNKKCIRQIQNAHQNSIYGLDYDQINDIIVSSSKDLSIKFFNFQNGELRINNQMSHDSFIMQIQLIKSNERLISTSFNELKIWSINLMRGQIMIIKSITQQHIFNFTSIMNDSLIVVIDQNFLNIFDESLGLVRNFLHNKEEQNTFLTYYQTSQLTSMKYILIMGQSNYYVIFQKIVNFQVMKTNNEFEFKIKSQKII
ncbi:WD repeat-containing protein 49 [Paramecium bursaria]